MNRSNLKLFVCWTMLVAAFASVALSQTPEYYIVNTVAGLGKYPYPGDGRSPTAVPLFEPRRAAYDSSGNLYFTDRYYCRVLRVSASGVLTSVAGNGLCQVSGDNGPATAASLQFVEGIAVDKSGNVYVGDYYRIRKISSDGVIRTIAGTGEPGYSGDGGPATAAKLGAPQGMTVDGSGNLFIADSENHVIRKVNAQGVISTIAGTGSPGFSGDNGAARSASLNQPQAVAVDSAGNIFIADFANNRVRKISVSGIMSTIAGTGANSNAGDGGAAVNATLSGPSGLTIDDSGDLLIACITNGYVRNITPDGVMHTLARFPVIDIAFNPVGVYFAVTDNVFRLVRRIQPNGTATTLAGFQSTSGIGDNGSATQAALLSPRGTVVDAKGNVYVADSSDNRIRRIDTDGVITTIAGTGNSFNTGDNGPAKSADILQPRAMAVDSAGNIYVTANTNVRRIDPLGIITNVAGTGSTGYSGDNGPATAAQVNYPGGLATDMSGNLYIADSNNHRVRRVSKSGVITTIAGTGARGYSGNGVPATSAQLNNPNGVAVDASGNLYIGDTQNDRIRKISTDGIIRDFAGTGEAGATGDGGPALQAKVDAPGTVMIDAAGNVVFTTGGGLIRRISPAGIIDTIAGNQSVEYSGDGDLATLAGMDPRGVSLGAEGKIYFSDLNNRRVRRLDPAQIFPAGMTNAATCLAGAVSPGEILVMYGEDLGPANLTGAVVNPDGSLANKIADFQMTFDGIPAPIVYLSEGQSSVIVPYGVAGKKNTVVQCIYEGKKSNSITLPVVDASPGIFTLNSSGQGPGAILNEDQSVNSATNPALRGSVIALWATGEGQTSPGGIDGKLATDAYPKPVLPPSVKIGDTDAEIVWYGTAPGAVAGVLQVNVRVPAGVTPSDAVPIVLKIGDYASRAGVTLAVR